MEFCKLRILNKNFMRLFFIILTTFLIYSCSSQKELSENSKEVQIIEESNMDPNLKGKWVLEYMSPVDGKNVQQLYKIQMPYLTFVDETKVAGNNGCNNIAGSYTLDGKSISFHTDDFKSTRMFCQGVNENAFIDILKTINNYTLIENGNKLMLLTTDIASMVFVKTDE